MTAPLTPVCGPPLLPLGFGRFLLFPSHSQQARVLLGFPWLLLLSFLGYLIVCLHDPIALYRFKMSMSFPNIRDLLASFSPSLDFFAISSGDGRIKVVRSLNVLADLGGNNLKFGSCLPCLDLNFGCRYGTP